MNSSAAGGRYGLAFVIVGIGIMLALAFARLHLAAPDMADRGSGPPPQLLGCLAPYDIPAGTIVTVARRPVGPAQDAGPSGHKMLAWDGPPAGVRKIPRERRLVETAGGTFLLPAGVDVEIRRPGFAPAILSAREPVRFAAADPATTYVLQVAGPEPANADDAVKAAQEGRADLVLPGQDRANAGAGLGEVRPGVVLKTLQPLSVQPWTGGATQQLEPSRLRAGGGFDRIDVQVQQSGTNFNGTGVSFTGCASVDARTHSLSVAQVSNQAVGSATVTLAMPRDILPSGIATLRSTISFVVASSDGRYVGAGSFVAFNPLVSGLVATAITAGLFAFAASLRYAGLREGGAGRFSWSRWIGGLFVGADGDPSLSLLQIFIWTVITVWGFIYVFLIAGSLLTVTQEMLVLLGIAGAGSILARLIATRSAPAAPPGDVNVDYSRLLTTNGTFDLLKLQLFVFTLLTGIYVVSQIAAAGAFPALNAETLLLLGVSQGVYVGGKLAAAQPETRLAALVSEIAILAEAETQVGDQEEPLKAKKIAGQTLDPPEAKLEEELAAKMSAIKAKLADLRKQREAVVKEVVARAGT